MGRRQLPHGRPDLPPAQRAAPPAPHPRAHQAAPARALGDQPGPVPGLHAGQPGDPRRPAATGSTSPARATAAPRSSPPPGWRGRTPRSTRASARTGSECGRCSGSSRHRAGPEPRQCPDPGFDPRGRRAGLRARPRGRRRLRPSRRHRGVHRRRRGGGDRPALRVVAVAQLPQPASRRRGAPDPAPQRLQDRRPHRPRPQRRRGRRVLPAQPGLGPGHRGR